MENSVEDIRDDLEMNIVHDQYDTPTELVGDIERMTDEVGRFTETFYFPLVGNMEDDEDGEQYEVGNRYLLYYEHEIRELFQKEQELDGTNMKDFFYAATAISVIMNMRFESCFKKSRISTART